MSDDKYEKYLGRPRTERLRKEMIKQMSNMAMQANMGSGTLQIKTGGDMSNNAKIDVVD